ncbi:MAG: LysM peptidoglycan-binding domain-containing protein [Janthinobacterium lividum]
MTTLNQTYQLVPGDTLDAVAATFHLTLPELLDANQQITNPNLVQVGERINIPCPAGTSAPAALAGTYDGIHPAPGTTNPDKAALIFPPVTSTAANRSQLLYDQVIDQLAVGYNPRYLPGGGCTYCNIFVWDVTRAMDCPIPHWIMPDGTIAAPNQPGASEININGGEVWMLHYGIPAHGWQPADAATAQQYANAGKPAVALWQNPAGHGHTAIVRAGEVTDRGPATAQAGSVNFNYGHLADGFGSIQPSFYVHV